jgi:hypothetical protein
MNKFDTVTPFVKFEYSNEFGDTTKFESNLNGVCLDDMFEIYKRFLLACGFYVSGDIIESEGVL